MRPLTATPGDRIAAPTRTKRGARDSILSRVWPATKGKGGKNGKTRASKRRRPPPRWLRPVLLAAVIAAPVLAATGIAYWSWQTGQVARALAWGDQTVDRIVAGLGLTVADVTVIGRQRTGSAEVLAALSVRRGDSLLGFDPKGARTRLERLAWVKTAAVSRRFPDTIEVRLVERRPFARWQHDGRLALIDRDGVTITSRGLAAYRRLIKVVGPGAPGKAAELVDMLLTEPALAARVADATLVRGRRWDLTFEGGIVARLPEDGAAGAWRLLARLEAEHRILSRDLVAVDLRVPDRLMLRLGPASAAARKAQGKST